jgi:2-hydroxychromene-2-carboxylate isomerase
MADALEFYFDFSSPYGYFASERVEVIGAEFGRQVIWRPYLLGVAFKATGQGPLVQQPLRGPYHLHDMHRSARKLKIPFQLPEGFPMATQAAARAFYWLDGQSADQAKALAQALYRTAFAKGRNIAPAETVAEIAAGLGHDPADVLEGIATPTVKDRLRAETDHALARGAFGSPFIFIGNEPFWGNDRLDDVRDWLRTGGW